MIKEDYCSRGCDVDGSVVRVSSRRAHSVAALGVALICSAFLFTGFVLGARRVKLVNF